MDHMYWIEKNEQYDHNHVLKNTACVNKHFDCAAYMGWPANICENIFKLI